MGAISRGDVSVLKDDLLSWSKELTSFEPHLEEAPSVEFCGDIVMGGDTPSIKHINPICSEIFDSTPISFPFSLTTRSHVHALHESLGDIR